jgi:hypothetical protein
MQVFSGPRRPVIVIEGETSSPSPEVAFAIVEALRTGIDQVSPAPGRAR